MSTIYDQQLDKNPANFVALSPVSFVERSAEIFGDLPSVVHGQRRYTWAQTLDRSARLAAARAEAMWVDMQLQAVRQARQMTQSDVGTAMGIEQAAISKLERRNDMHVSTLREYIRALGGELKLVASFPDGDVTLNPMLSEP